MSKAPADKNFVQFLGSLFVKVFVNEIQGARWAGEKQTDTSCIGTSPESPASLAVGQSSFVASGITPAVLLLRARSRVTSDAGAIGSE
ncbi:hypothetical protein [Stieleria magnilauensis]|uniref:hypothetical protein n=1 Tax=Stieleria magnilauensis TaxID=2527963 RepID=UPI003AF5B45E